VSVESPARWTRTVYLMTGMTLAAQLTLAAAQHPRPDFERTQWQSLNGAWEFQFDPEDVGIGEKLARATSPLRPHNPRALRLGE
jgi:maltooligosyltrehalose synthase